MEFFAKRGQFPLRYIVYIGVALLPIAPGLGNDIESAIRRDSLVVTVEKSPKGPLILKRVFQFDSKTFNSGSCDNCNHSEIITDFVGELNRFVTDARKGEKFLVIFTYNSIEGPNGAERQLCIGLVNRNGLVTIPGFNPFTINDLQKTIQKLDDATKSGHKRNGGN